MKKELNNIAVFVGRFPPYYGGGAMQVEKVLVEIAKNYPNILINVYVLTSKKIEIKKRYADNLRVKVITIRTKSILRYVEVIINGFVPIIYSSVILFGLSSYVSLILIFLANILGKKTILRTSLIGYDDADSIYRRFKYNSGNLFINLIDIIICNSLIIERSYVDGGFHQKTFYIPNGIDTDYYRPLTENIVKKRLRKKYGIPENNTVLVYTGAFSTRKNIEFLIQVLIELKRIDNQYVLLMAGPTSADKYIAFDDRYWQRIQTMIAENGLQKDVFITSYEDRDKNVYQVSDIYISASLAEGMPNSMLEAMACGLPVVALDLDDNLDNVVKEGDNGFLVKSEDYYVFAKKIHRIANNCALKEKYGLKSREITKAEFAIHKTAVRYLDVISKSTKLDHFQKSQSNPKESRVQGSKGSSEIL